MISIRIPARGRAPVFLLPFLLPLLSGCGRGGAEEERPAAPEPVPVVTARVARTTLHPFLEILGVVAAVPERTALVTARTAGVVEKVKVLPGEKVEKGQVLVELDPRTAQAALAGAKARVAEKEALLEKLRRGPRPQEVEAARKDAAKAEASLEEWKAKTAALEPLMRRKEISPVQYRETLAALARARAEAGAAKARLDLLLAGTRPEEIARAEADLAAARAEMEGARLALEYCRISSPLSGTAVRVPARMGERVDPGTLLVRVADLSSVFAVIRIPGPYLSRVRPGAAVEIGVPSLEGRKYEGKILRMAKEADDKTGDVEAFALVCNEEGLLLPGLAFRAKVRLPDVKGALVVPAEAVADRNGTAVVTRIRDGRAYEIEVVPGERVGEAVQILKGLSAGDVVALRGGYGLPPGTPVREAAKKK